MKHQHQEITHDKKTGRVRVRTINTEPTMTQQQFKEECDINNIVKKHANSGQITHLNPKRGAFHDFSQLTDYQQMLDTVLSAQDAFQTLPADVRIKFRNDPAQLLQFLQDDKNYDEAIKLGLLDSEKTKQTLEKREKLKNANTPKTKTKSESESHPES